jgi:glycosyltransferase involved in cell wall biosynthesis
MVPAMLAVIVPTLNAAATLPACLRAVGADLPVVMVDGGSTDATRALGHRFMVDLVETAAGRGGQLAAGAEAAIAGGAEWLLFLHADTVLDAGWRSAAETFMADPANAGRAAHFVLAFDDDGPAARRVARLANWRARVLGLPYGDQGLLIAVPFYRSLGGVRPLPLMEDVDLVRRIGRDALTELPATATTSAEKYRRDGWWRRPLRNLACLSLFLLGLPPGLIARLYR